MLSVDKILERENVLLKTYNGKAVCVKKFPSLGVKIVQDENGQCFLISANREGVFSNKTVNYGTCNKSMSEKETLAFLKDFCFAPIREEINPQTQNDFDVLLGFATPTEALMSERFVNLLKTEIDALQKQERLTSSCKFVDEKLNPLLKSIDMAVSVAKSQPNTSVQVEKFFNSLGL